jgi:hypothetical protein
MLPRFAEHEVRDLVRKVDELHARFPTLDNYLLSEVFYSENRALLNRREPNSARATTAGDGSLAKGNGYEGSSGER